MMTKGMVKLLSVALISNISMSSAFAQGHQVKVTLCCPDISVHSLDKIINYGTYLGGRGTERVNSDEPTYPLFKGPVSPGSNIPIDLVMAGYGSDSVSYNPATGSVTCSYKSTKGFSPFSMSYLMKNALNGTVTGATAEQIHIKFPVGLK